MWPWSHVLCTTDDVTMLADDATMIADDAIILADDATVLAHDAITLADDVTLLADDECDHVNDDAAMLADDVIMLADDVTMLADNVSVLADDAAMLADDAAMLADDVIVLADDVAMLADDTTMLADDWLLLTHTSKEFAAIRSHTCFHLQADTLMIGYQDGSVSFHELYDVDEENINRRTSKCTQSPPRCQTAAIAHYGVSCWSWFLARRSDHAWSLLLVESSLEPVAVLWSQILLSQCRVGFCDRVWLCVTDQIKNEEELRLSDLVNKRYEHKQSIVSVDCHSQKGLYLTCRYG